MSLEKDTAPTSLPLLVVQAGGGSEQPKRGTCLETTGLKHPTPFAGAVAAVAPMLFTLDGLVVGYRLGVRDRQRWPVFLPAFRPASV